METAGNKMIEWVGTQERSVIIAEK